MGIQLDHKRLSITRVAGQGLCEVNVQRSVALPPHLPDLTETSGEAVLWARGIPVITSVEPADGQLRVVGHIECSILYIADGDTETVRSMSAEEPRFEASIPAPGVRPGDEAVASVQLSQLEAETTGARGVLLTATLVASASAVRTESVDVAVSAQATGGSRIACQQDEIILNREAASVSESVRVSEKIEIPTGYPPCGSEDAVPVCAAVGRAKIISAQAADGKVTVDGEIEVELAYAAARGVPAVSIIRRDRVPLHRVLDVAEARKDMSVKAEVVVRRVDVVAVSPEEFAVDIGTDVSACLIESEKLAVVVDISSETQEIVDLDTATIAVDNVVGDGKVEVDLQDVAPLHSLVVGRKLSGMEEIKSLSTIVGVSEAEASSGEVTVRGIATARVVFEDVAEDDDGQFPTAFGVDIPVEFSDSVEIPGVTDHDLVQITTATGAVVVEKSAQGKLELGGTIRVDVAIRRHVGVSVVTVAETLAPAKLDPCAMTFYVVSPGDSLSRIARRYGVPLDRIASANGIGPADVLESGQKVYIPARK